MPWQDTPLQILRNKLTAMLQQNQNFSTGQNNMLNQAQAVAQQRLASRQIAQPYNTAAPYEFAQDQAYTNPRQNLQKLPPNLDKKDVVAPPTPPVAPDKRYHHPVERPITAQPYDPFVPPFGKSPNPRPSPLVFPTAPPTSVNPSVSNFGEYSDNNQRYSDTTGPDSNYFVEATPAPPVTPPPAPVEPVAPDERPITAQPYDPFVPPFGKSPNIGREPTNTSDNRGTGGDEGNGSGAGLPISQPTLAPVFDGSGGFFDRVRRSLAHPEMISNDRASLRDSSAGSMFRGGRDGSYGGAEIAFDRMSRGGEGGNRGGMFAGGGLASLTQTNYYKTPDLLQPVSQQPQPTQPVIQPFTRQRVQEVIPNAWDKKAPAPQTHVDPVILDTVTKLSQGISPLEGQNRGGGGAPASSTGIAGVYNPDVNSYTTGYTSVAQAESAQNQALANQYAQYRTLQQARAEQAAAAEATRQQAADRAVASLAAQAQQDATNRAAQQAERQAAVERAVANENYSNEGRNSSGGGGGGGGGGDGGGGAATGGSGGDASGGGDRGTRGGFSAGGYISPRPKKKKR